MVKYRQPCQLQTGPANHGNGTCSIIFIHVPDGFSNRNQQICQWQVCFGLPTELSWLTRTSPPPPSHYGHYGTPPGLYIFLSWVQGQICRKLMLFNMICWYAIYDHPNIAIMDGGALKFSLAAIAKIQDIDTYITWHYITLRYTTVRDIELHNTTLRYTTSRNSTKPYIALQNLKAYYMFSHSSKITFFEWSPPWHAILT